jgi:hypothetical protein
MTKPWTESYWELMIAANFEKAIPLRDANFPPSFFKYRNLSERTIETLTEGYIWLAEISTLNDPFECSIQFDNDECLREYYASDEFEKLFKTLTGHAITKAEIKLLLASKKPYEEYIKLCESRNIPFGFSAEEQIRRVQERWAEIIEETSKNLRICSFSLTKHILLLWSHYSQEHKGICIEYDFLDSDSIRTFIQPVMYSNNVYKLGLLEEYNTMQMIGSSLIKSKDWEHEQEWRVTIFKQKDEFPQKLSAPLPKAIYLGTRFHLNENSLKQKLYQYSTDNKIPMYQMVIKGPRVI